MISRRSVPLMFLGAALGGRNFVHPAAAGVPSQYTQSHVVWVVEVLKRMQTIIPGMTRNDLLKVFTTEGGLFTSLRRKYVSRDCGYFKVDVEFEAVGRPNRDQSGRVTPVEDSRDTIIKISKPYLELGIFD